MHIFAVIIKGAIAALACTQKPDMDMGSRHIHYLKGPPKPKAALQLESGLGAIQNVLQAGIRIRVRLVSQTEVRITVHIRSIRWHRCQVPAEQAGNLSKGQQWVDYTASISKV